MAAGLRAIGVRVAARRPRRCVVTARVGLVLWFFLLAPALVPVRTADAAMRPIGNRTELARLVLGLDVERAARRQMVERIAVERARLAEDRASAAAALEGRHLDGARAKEHLQNVSAARRTAAQEHAQARARVASLEDALKAAAGALASSTGSEWPASAIPRNQRGSASSA